MLLRSFRWYSHVKNYLVQRCAVSPYSNTAFIDAPCTKKFFTQLYVLLAAVFLVACASTAKTPTTTATHCLTVGGEVIKYDDTQTRWCRLPSGNVVELQHF